MNPQIPLDPAARADTAEYQIHDDGTHEMGPDLAYKRLAMVNVVYVGAPDAGDRGWTLVDTGVPGSAGVIMRGAESRFGKEARPAAIILTHGHFDHVGTLEKLAEHWDVPIYAHDLERPYLDGSASYPKPDALVGGGIMPLLAPLFPRSPVDVNTRLQILPADGSVPHLPEWRWIATPGHTVGHISLWREADRSLIVGDAFITTRQESAYAIATQSPEMHGPPAYFTPDWQSAEASVKRLAALDPELVITGHGRPMRGPLMREALHELANRFAVVAVPDSPYVEHPATASDGSAYQKP